MPALCREGPNTQSPAISKAPRGKSFPLLQAQECQGTTAPHGPQGPGQRLFKFKTLAQSTVDTEPLGLREQIAEQRTMAHSHGQREGPRDLQRPATAGRVLLSKQVQAQGFPLPLSWLHCCR